MPNPENLTGKGFDSNPENINKKGRPRKSFNTINKELKDKGITPLTKSHLIEAYELIFNSNEEDLKKIASDESTPYGLKLIIKELNDKKTRSKALADYRDYMFGKAKESRDITTNGENIDNTINFVGLDD